MKERYKRRIHAFAEKSLERMLRSEIGPYLSHIPAEIEDEIARMIAAAPLPEEESLGPKARLGSALQSLGKEVAGRLFPVIKSRAIPCIEKEIEVRRKELERKISHVDNMDTYIEDLKDLLQKGLLGEAGYWRGADVVVSPDPIPKDQLPWTHSGDVQVVTGSELTARNISWLFRRAGEILHPVIDYQTKYMLYGELAQAANRILTSENAYRREDVYDSIISRLECLKTELLPIFIKYCEREKNSIKATEEFVGKHSLNRKSGEFWGRYVN